MVCIISKWKKCATPGYPSKVFGLNKAYTPTITPTSNSWLKWKLHVTVKHFETITTECLTEIYNAVCTACVISLVA